MMLDLKEKIGYLKKNSSVVLYQSVVLFSKILVKRVDHFLVGPLLECSGPATPDRAPRLKNNAENVITY